MHVLFIITSGNCIYTSSFHYSISEPRKNDFPPIAFLGYYINERPSSPLLVQNIKSTVTAITEAYSFDLFSGHDINGYRINWGANSLQLYPRTMHQPELYHRALCQRIRTFFTLLLHKIFNIQNSLFCHIRDFTWAFFTPASLLIGSTLKYQS